MCSVGVCAGGEGVDVWNGEGVSGNSGCLEFGEDMGEERSSASACSSDDITRLSARGETTHNLWAGLHVVVS